MTENYDDDLPPQIREWLTELDCHIRNEDAYVQERISTKEKVELDIDKAIQRRAGFELQRKAYLSAARVFLEERKSENNGSPSLSQSRASGAVKPARGTHRKSSEIREAVLVFLRGVLSAKTSKVATQTDCQLRTALKALCQLKLEGYVENAGDSDWWRIAGPFQTTTSIEVADAAK